VNPNRPLRYSDAVTPAARYAGGKDRDNVVQ
jgi:hypothetical protein